MVRPGLAGTETNATFYEQPSGSLSALVSVTQHMDDGQAFYLGAFTQWVDIPPPPAGTPQSTVRVIWNAAYTAISGTNTLSTDDHFAPFSAQVVGWQT